MRRTPFGRAWLPLTAIAAAAVGLYPPTPTAAKAAPASSAPPLRLTLPAPAGPYPAGTVSLHLTDPARRDPWLPSHPVRELMVSITYPATDAGGYPAAPWLPAAAAAHFLAGLHVPPGRIQLPVTHSHQGAPVDQRAGRLPVVLFSPGAKADRSSDTALVEGLASHGYAVVTIDHTHDSGEVEFPGGRLAVSALPPDSDSVNTEATAVREADTRFVLDELTMLDTGHNPDTDQHPLPWGLAGDLDLGHVGMFGFSIGGAATANAMHDDPRIAAGVDLDGTVWGPVAATGLDRPFMLVSSQDNGRNVDPTWQQLWQHLRGWRLDLRLTGAEHLTFSDAAVLYPQASAVLGLTSRQLDQLVGTIDGTRAVVAESAYVQAFFDRWLRHSRSALLDEPSPRYPEMQFIR
jgi:predicted dienelactone hydrolase